MAAAFASELTENGGDLLTGAEVTGIDERADGAHVETTRGKVAARRIINCAGLHADRIARMMGVEPGLRIVPFRGEYFSIRPERRDLVRGLIYPVPNPRLPFLGVHFTRRIDGSVEAGPNAVLALAREGYRKTSFHLGEALSTLTYPGFWRMSATYWRSGISEQYRSMRKRSFLESLQKLVPDIRLEDLTSPGAGVRAQAIDRRGNLVQDFAISETQTAIHVPQRPIPGATSALTISRYIADMAARTFDLGD